MSFKRASRSLGQLQIACADLRFKRIICVDQFIHDFVSISKKNMFEHCENEFSSGPPMLVLFRHLSSSNRWVPSWVGINKTWRIFFFNFLLLLLMLLLLLETSSSSSILIAKIATTTAPVSGNTIFFFFFFCYFSGLGGWEQMYSLKA